MTLGNYGIWTNRIYLKRVGIQADHRPPNLRRWFLNLWRYQVVVVKWCK